MPAHCPNGLVGHGSTAAGAPVPGTAGGTAGSVVSSTDGALDDAEESRPSPPTTPAPARRLTTRRPGRRDLSGLMVDMRP
eukprot:1065767-Prymnesium_polylepis.1